MSDDRIQSFEAFWPHYVGEHRRPLDRALHYLGTSLALTTAARAVLGRKPARLLRALVYGYGPAWVGHFIVEKNRPATFQYPLWSLRADFKMLGLALRGQMAGEVTRLYGSSNPAPDAPLLAER